MSPVALLQARMLVSDDDEGSHAPFIRGGNQIVHGPVATANRRASPMPASDRPHPDTSESAAVRLSRLARFALARSLASASGDTAR